MTNNENSKGWKKKLAKGAVALATIAGTFGGIKDEGFAPINNVKEGTSYGINVGVMNKLDSGATHYGVNVGLGTNLSKDARICGLNLNFINELDGGRIYGANFGILNADNKPNSHAAEINGLEIGLFNMDEPFNDDQKNRQVNGLQIGVYNEATAGNLGQVGIYNAIQKPDSSWKETGALNWYFAGSE